MGADVQELEAGKGGGQGAAGGAGEGTGRGWTSMKRKRGTIPAPMKKGK